MNILFLTLLDFSSTKERGIYTDLIREFVKGNNNVFIISPSEKRKREPERLIDAGNAKILKTCIGNIQKTTLIEKGIAILTIEPRFKAGIRKHCQNIKFDLIVYSTPPITLCNVVKYIKKRDNAKTYLLLKDIFPQNAVDLGMFSKRSMIYKFFRAKEKKLYSLSDFIGCMSPANVRYLLKHNPDIPAGTVEVCPNSLEPLKIDKDENLAEEVRKKYNIPLDKTVFIYGGNIGKPQGVDFVVEAFRANQYSRQAYFIVVGAGTEFGKLKSFIDIEKPGNIKLFKQMPKDDYDMLVNACDAGLIFLDRRFTIPNFPSRILSYMQASIPVLAATDINTDLGQIITAGKFGLWSESGNIEAFTQNVKKLCDAGLRKQMGANARKHMENHYTAKYSYETIMKHLV